MKKIYLFIAALFAFAMGSNAQNTFPATGSVGIGTTSPNASSLMELKSTKKGILIPRMTQAQRNSIISPTTGLMIFQTDVAPTFYWYTGSGWKSVGGAGRDLANLINTTAVNSSLLPGSSGAIDLGSSSKKWRQGYFSRTLSSDSLIVTSGLGIGIQNPAVKFHVVSGTAGSMKHPYETAIVEKNGDTKLGVYTSVTNPTYDASSIVLGYSNYKMSNSLYPNYEMQQGIFASDPNAYYLRFNAIPRNDEGIVTNETENVFIMDNLGNVGIHLNNDFPSLRPTANLHVNGSVRFQNLPYGSGDALVIDADGNIFRNYNALERPANEVLSDDVKALKDEIANLKSQIELLLKSNNQKDPVTIINSKKQFLIYPNPTNDIIKISALSESTFGDKKVVFQNIEGKIINSFSMNNNNLSIPARNIASGIYIVNIYQNSNLLHSEKVIVK